MMNKKQLVLPAVLAIIMVLAVTAIARPGKKQDTRGGAYFAGTDVMILPNDISKKVGDEFGVDLMIQTKPVNGGELAKVDFVEGTLCYGPELSLDAKTVRDKVTLGPTFSEIFSADIKNIDGKNCLNLNVASNKPNAELGSGIIKVAQVKFKVVKNGIGKISVNQAGTHVSGYNPNVTSMDTGLQLGVISEASYNIGGVKAPAKSCGFLGLRCLWEKLMGKTN
jgi:hypothetical protein